MKVKRLHLQNYGRFEDLTIDFAPTSEKMGNVTVIVGNNGAGKSQVLQALATGFSWFVARLSDENADGVELTQFDIKNNKHLSSIKISIEDLSWIEKIKNGLRKIYRQIGKLMRLQRKILDLLLMG